MGQNSPPSILTTIGDRAWHFASNVATLTFTPLYNLSARVTRIRITNPSASDVWILSISGKEICRFIVDTLGNQHLLGLVGTTNVPTNDIFSYVHNTLKRDMSFPVPNSQSITIASVGGATANIAIQYEEHPRDAIKGTDLNGAESKHWLLPVYAYLAAAVAAAGTYSVDTRVAGSWTPNFFLPTSGFSNAVMPAGWRGLLLALFLDPVGVNNFSGAADHKANTNYLQVIRNSQPLFTRDNTGIPMLGAPAANGSANQVFQSGIGDLPPFDRSIGHTRNLLDIPIQANLGDVFAWNLNVSGDFTGNQSFAKSYICTLAEMWES